MDQFQDRDALWVAVVEQVTNRSHFRPHLEFNGGVTRPPRRRDVAGHEPLHYDEALTRLPHFAISGR